jgi:hypothetical protein
VNCEQVPLLPARVVACILDDTGKIPYLLIWKSRPGGTVKEVARVGTGHSPRPESWLFYVFISTEEAEEAGVL